MLKKYNVNLSDPNGAKKFKTHFMHEWMRQNSLESSQSVDVKNKETGERTLGRKLESVEEQKMALMSTIFQFNKSALYS